MKRPKAVYIYGLKDPRDDQIHYIGKADDVQKRLVTHLKDRKNNAGRVAWIDELRAAGQEPGIVVLEESIQDEWREAEIYWIAKGRELGWPLLNIHKGGTGGGDERPDFNWFKPYIRSDQWDKFDSLPLLEKETIFRTVAQVMVKYCLIVIKAGGGSSSLDYNPGLQFAAGRTVAIALIEAVHDDIETFTRIRDAAQGISANAIALMDSYIAEEHFITLYDG